VVQRVTAKTRGPGGETQGLLILLTWHWLSRLAQPWSAPTNAFECLWRHAHGDIYRLDRPGFLIGRCKPPNGQPVSLSTVIDGVAMTNLPYLHRHIIEICLDAIGFDLRYSVHPRAVTADCRRICGAAAPGRVGIDFPVAGA